MTQASSVIPSRIKRGRGHIPDRPAFVAGVPSLKHLVGARVRAGNGVRMDDHVEAVRDQGQTSACVAFALAAAVQVRCSGMGRKVSRPSERALYDFGRELEMVDASQPLVDAGSEPGLVMAGAKRFGCPPSDAFPFDEAKINERPAEDVFRAASCFILTGYYAVDTEGSYRVADACHALDAGYPLILGVDVDEAFDAYDAKGGDLQRPDPKTVDGRHMTCLLGYERSANGVRFRGLNSWTASWGDHGFYWGSEAWLTDAGVNGIYAVTCGPA